MTMIIRRLIHTMRPKLIFALAFLVLFLASFARAADSDITPSFFPPGVKITQDSNGQITINQELHRNTETGELSGPRGLLPPELWEQYEKRCQRETTWWGRLLNKFQN